MKISEISKELGIESKEIISFVNQKGIECKAATKNLTDEETDMVRKAFSKKEEKKETKPSAETKDKEEQKTEVKSEKPVQSEVKSEKAQNTQNAQASEKKSSKFNFKINPQFISNPSSAQKRPNQPQGQQQNRNQAQNRNVNQGPIKLIKPTTPPSQAPSVNIVPERPIQNTPKNNVKPKEELKQETPVAVQPEKEVVKENKPAHDAGQNKNVQREGRETQRENRDGQRDGREQRPFQKNFGEGKPQFNRDGQGQRDRNGQFNRDGQGQRDGNRPQRNGGFNKFGNQGGMGKDMYDKDAEPRDNRFVKKSQPKFDASAQGAGVDKRKDDSKRRNSQEKDKKKNSYDDKYEDGAGQKGRKVGAFIKPEKKVETVEEDIKVLVLPEVLTIRDLADKMKLQPSTIVKKLFLAGEIVTVNTEISFEKAEEIAMEYDILCEKEEKVDVIEELLKEEEESEEVLVERPPVICVMGHVDHGKTSLLDAIRNTHVIEREAGGITQHIGAYQVKINDKNITFLDTPGHEAFTAMRMRGATSTDIAVLVVAADDGVMPQTVEAISHAKAAGVPIIVAVNKVDKIGYDFEDTSKDMTYYPQITQLMTELSSDHGLNPEAWGGETIFVPVSAKKGLGIDNLLENILISAEILELKSNPNRKARGLVIEAKLDKGRGPVATVLVQKGTLKVGDFISAGEAHGKVRAMINDKKENVKVATPSTPVEILGLNQAPSAGDVFIAHENDRDAKHFADTFIAEHKIKKIEDTKGKMSLDDVYTKIKEDNLKSLNIIVKADVQGSVEAVRQSLEKISNDEVVVKVIHGGVGAINESDVTLASASEAIIIGFNVRIDNQAKETSEREGVDVRLYSVIYQAIEDVEAAMKGLLDPVFEEKVIGHCEVRQIFKANAIGNIAGSYVLDGIVKRGCLVRITREGEQIFEGKLASLKRFKDDVKEVKTGFECGLVFDGFNGIQELDIVEAYEMVEVPR